MVGSQLVPQVLYYYWSEECSTNYWSQPGTRIADFSVTRIAGHRGLECKVLIRARLVTGRNLENVR